MAYRLVQLEFVFSVLLGVFCRHECAVLSCFPWLLSMHGFTLCRAALIDSQLSGLEFKP